MPLNIACNFSSLLDFFVVSLLFILRTTNPFEKMILDQLKDLIKDGCTQKEAIMKLMCANVINHAVLAAPEVL